MVIFKILIFVALIIAFWFIPIKYGIKWAKIKNISNLWMLFGIHPFMGWIAYLVIKHGVEPRKTCTQCQEGIKLKAKICRYCRNEMSQEEINQTINEFEERKK
tara:strand:- start:93 stop:401 length:309 start_codon:yes stop_codon:yes gene_type:complete